jgi:carbonic anhydrase/acetyltransferase-like protein (isoleucine patch superfamily)
MILPFLDKTPVIPPGVYVSDNAMVIGDVEIGEESSVWFGSVVRGDVNYIRIGARTNLQDMCVIHVNTGTHPTVLEDEITVGHRVTLHGCYVESGCLVGIGSTVLDGAHIGRQSLIAAGSLVTPNTQIPPRSLVMGAPARVKRELTDDEVDGIKKNVRGYVELAARYLSMRAA